MALFPRFGAESPAKIAKSAKVEADWCDRTTNIRNFRRFRSKAEDEIEPTGKPDDHIAQRVADIADAYVERLAIVMESGDICWSEARCIAEAEVGRRFVETFLPSEIAS
jgi:hypothetical protein